MFAALAETDCLDRVRFLERLRIDATRRPDPQGRESAELITGTWADVLIERRP